MVNEVTGTNALPIVRGWGPRSTEMVDELAAGTWVKTRCETYMEAWVAWVPYLTGKAGIAALQAAFRASGWKTKQKGNEFSFMWR